MSLSSFALTRPHPGRDDIANLAEEHYKHDLTDTDRAALTSAASSIGTHATIGSALGLCLGALLALRLRRARMRMFDAVRARERPVGVRFRDGREEAIPDLTPLMKPSAAGDVAAYTLFGIAGLFLGGETGLLTGSAVASRRIGGDEEGKGRIEKAARKFRADVLRREADELDGGRGVVGMMGL